MPSLFQAYLRHANHFLNVVHQADSLFLDEKTQTPGIEIFDKSRKQIDVALNWICQQQPSEQSDILLVLFVEAVTAIGLRRYHVANTLIPLCQQQVAAAQRLGWREIESDALDGLGILYAFLGYKRQALAVFEEALQIAIQTRNHDLESTINAHLKLARSQLENKTSTARQLETLVGRSWGLVQIILLYLQLVIAWATRRSSSEGDLLNSLAETYSLLGKHNVSIFYHKKALAICHKISYRFGEIRALVGLVYDNVVVAQPDTGTARLLLDSASQVAEDIGFEWSTDLSVISTLLEIAPVIQKIEQIAKSLSANEDPRGEAIYQILDQIIMRTSEIVATMAEGEAAQPPQQLLISLQGLVDDLRNINQILPKGSEA